MTTKLQRRLAKRSYKLILTGNDSTTEDTSTDAELPIDIPSNAINNQLQFAMKRQD